MCTVTFIPLGENSYILTSNRDEDPARQTSVPDKNTLLQHEGYLVYPKDQRAGGTWIAVSPENRLVCLLNGAFIKHKHQPPYRKSRGLVALEYFDFPDAASFCEATDLDQIEPFTLVMVDPDCLTELRWDGTQKYKRELDRKASHIWSSATLYPEHVAQDKEVKFREFMESFNQRPKQEDIRHFQSVGYKLDLPVVKTVSVTCVVNDGSQATVYYDDVLNNQSVVREVKLHAPQDR